jgi:hypothetical protein
MHQKNINKEKEARIKSQEFKVVQQDFLRPQQQRSFFFTSIKIQ